MVERRSIGQLLDEAISIYARNRATVLTLSAAVVAVVDLILGIGLGELTGHYRSRTSTSENAVTIAASALVTTPLITAMLARAVLDIRAGDRPSVAVVAGAGLDSFAPVLGAVVLYIGSVLLGALLILPGIFFAVSFYFAAQAVVIDGRRGFAALARSHQLVRGNWFHAFATGLIFSLLVGIPGSLVATGFDALARQANAEVLVVLGDFLFATLALPLVAIGATLYYLDLRVRAGE